MVDFSKNFAEYAIISGIALACLGALNIIWPWLLSGATVAGVAVAGVGFLLVFEGMRWEKTMALLEAKKGK